MHKTATYTFGLIVSLILAAPAAAGPITGNMAQSTSGLGNFSGTLDYSAADATHATLNISLTNTTSAAIGGYLTGFVLNNPGNHITGVTSLTTNFASFQALGGPTFQNSVTGAPYGQFDLGASTFTSFEGGGAPSVGIGVGQTGTFQFALTGTALTGLTTADFMNELSVPPGQGMGAEFFVARFRGMFPNNPDAQVTSDKVPAGHDSPEPSTLFLAALGAICAGSAYRRRRNG